MTRRPRALATAALAILLSLPVASESGAGGGKGEFAVHLARLGALGRRTEGNAAEASALAYIRQVCVASGLRFRERDLSDLVDDHSYSRSLAITFDGARSDLLTVITPLDAHADGPEGEGDAGIALALAAAQDLGLEAARAGKPPISVEFLFLGGERRGPYAEGGTDAAGSRWWIDSVDESRAGAVIYLSLDRVPGMVGLRNAGPGILSPYWLFERCRAALAGSGFEYRLFPNRTQAYRLGVLARPGPLVPYLAAGIPAIEFVSEEGGAPSADPEAAIGRFLTLFLEENRGGFLDTWDRDYSSFQIGAFSFVIREGPYVVFLLAFTSLATLVLLGVSIARRGSIPSLMRKLPRRVGNLAVLLVVAGASFLSTWLCLRLEAFFLGSPEAWLLRPTLFSLGRIVVTLSLFLGLLSWFVSLRWLSPDPWFYEAAALVVLGGDVILFPFVSLPLSIYFCWGFALALASILIRRRVASILAIALVYLPFGLLVSEVIAAPGSASLAALLSPDLATGLIVVVASLPFASLTASPFLFLAPRGERQRRRAAVIFISLAVLVEAGLLGAGALAVHEGPVTVAETLDQDAGTFALEARSVARIGTLDLLRRGVRLHVETATDRAIIDGNDGVRVISFRSEEKTFLDRVSHRVRLGFTRRPASIEIRLSAKTPMTLYDCSLPYKLALDGLSARIFVGPGAPEPLELELTTGPEFAATLWVRAGYPSPGEVEAAGGGRPLEPGASEVLASFPLMTGSP